MALASVDQKMQSLSVSESPSSCIANNSGLMAVGAEAANTITTPGHGHNPNIQTVANEAIGSNANLTHRVGAMSFQFGHRARDAS